MQLLSQEVTTGKTANLTEKLSGDFAGLSGLEHRLALLDSFATARADAGRMADAAQIRLGALTETVGDMGRSLLSLAQSPTAQDLSGLRGRANAAFADAVANLNGASAGRALFSGIATDQKPLPEPEEILNELRSVVAGAATAAQIWSDLESWFDDPAGYQSIVYQGSDQSLADTAISENQAVSVSIKADEPALKNALKDLAAAVFAVDPALSLSEDQSAELLQLAGTSLIATQDALTGESAELGVIQERIEKTAIRMETERLTLEIARGELLGADPYEAATKLETAQFQLEALYSITVRTSQLSLVNFLR